MASPIEKRSHKDRKSELLALAEKAHARFTETHGVRERALRLCREVVRSSANSIRATHRGEFKEAEKLLDRVSAIFADIEGLLQGHPAVYYAGYVEDAQKEYVEASATLSFAKGAELSGLDELGVGPAPYLNGLAEAVGEMRRFILDSLRRDDFGRCEDLLDIMDEVYTILVSMDFPDAVTRGLRRSTDVTRSILERTRGDLTFALRQQRLEEKLDSFWKALADRGAGDDQS